MFVDTMLLGYGHIHVGWMMKTKELVVAYKRAEWRKFEALCSE